MSRHTSIGKFGDLKTKIHIFFFKVVNGLIFFKWIIHYGFRSFLKLFLNAIQEIWIHKRFMNACWALPVARAFTTKSSALLVVILFIVCTLFIECQMKLFIINMCVLLLFEYRFQIDGKQCDYWLPDNRLLIQSLWLST